MLAVPPPPHPLTYNFALLAQVLVVIRDVVGSKCETMGVAGAPAGGGGLRAHAAKYGRP